MSACLRPVGCAVLTLALLGCNEPSATQGGGSASLSASAPAPVPALSGSVAPHVAPALSELMAVHHSDRSAADKRKAVEDVFSKLTSDHSQHREDLFVELVKRKLFDEPEWVTLTTRFRGHVGEIGVSSDALKLHGVRFDLTGRGVQRVADLLGTTVPTAFILELIWEQATVRLKPCTLPADDKMATTKRMIMHSRCVDEAIAGRKGLVSNVGKHWVLSNRLLERADAAANHGWFRHGHRPIQNVGIAHSTGHTDYSQVVRLVKRKVRVNGLDMDFQHVARSQELWGLVSNEGPLRVVRTIKHREPHAEEPAPKASEPPRRPDASAVSASLAEGSFPLNVEQLPDDTEGLRAVRVVTEVAEGLRLHPDDLPEEALWSHAAAFCGSRDVFFELMDDLKVTEDSLKKDAALLKQGIACGRKLVAELGKQARTFEVDFRFEAGTHQLGIFPTAVDKLLADAHYALLSPTPSGVFAAACRDDFGPPQSGCREEDDARLLLEIKGGLLGAHAKQLPALIKRMTSPAKPPAESAAIHALFTELAGADDVMVERGRHCAATLSRSLTGLPLTPEGHETLAVDLSKYASVCASARSGIPREGNVTFVYRARSKAEADKLAVALKRRANQLDHEPSYPEHLGATEKKYLGALHAARKRAMHEAETKRDGKEIRVTRVVKPTAAEHAAMSQHEEERKARAAAAARVVRALEKGEAPKPEDIEAASTEG